MLSSILELTTTTFGCICSSTGRVDKTVCKTLSYKTSNYDIFSSILYTSDAAVTKTVRIVLGGLPYTTATLPAYKLTN